jgi:hypothetical protein
MENSKFSSRVMMRISNSSTLQRFKFEPISRQLSSVQIFSTEDRISVGWTHENRQPMHPRRPPAVRHVSWGGPEDEPRTKLTKVQPFARLPSSDPCKPTGARHSQVCEYAHSRLFLVGVEEAIGVPFVSVWSPNLWQAVQSTSTLRSCYRSMWLTDYTRR